MSLLNKVLRRWTIPLGAITAIPFLSPVVFADTEKEEKMPRKVRPKDLPIYESPDDIYEYEYIGKPKTALEEGIGMIRESIENTFGETQVYRDKMFNIIETAKTHTQASIAYVMEEDNTIAKGGVIALGGLTGLIMASRRKGGFLKKITYTSAGMAAVASLFYPQEAQDFATLLYSEGKTYSLIAYNFIIGVKPKSSMEDATKNQESTETAENTSEMQNSQDITEPLNKDIETNVVMHSSVAIEGDFGQANPADKDMYTTRS